MYTRVLATLFYLEYGLYFSCGLHAQNTQRETHDTDEEDEDDTYDDLPYL